MTDIPKLPDSTVEHIATAQLSKAQTAEYLGLTVQEFERSFDLRGVQFHEPAADFSHQTEPLNPPA